MATRIIIGISGASGFQYGVKALELLRPHPVEVHLVVSKGAEKTCELETDYRTDDVMALADVVYPIANLGAAISSGSFKTLGMLIAPCSMRSLGAIAHCLTDNLLTRAADVVLKRASPHGAAGPGNTAEPWPYPQYGRRNRNGRNYLSAGPGALPASANGGRHRYP